MMALRKVPYIGIVTRVALKRAQDWWARCKEIIKIKPTRRDPESPRSNLDPLRFQRGPSLLLDEAEDSALAEWR